MNFTEIRLKLKDTSNISCLDLARFVKSISIYSTNSDALSIAREMFSGKQWSPTEEVLKFDPRECIYAEHFDFDVDEKPDLWSQRAAELLADSKIWELQKLGATGDAEAAIAFCKAIADGTLSIYSPAFA